ncbi:MAG: LysM peptidoglycan-binding domain-containing protein [Spirochaetaceae bacterium]|nr:LysM peptidoglycan-binding domain-containing protein [Spirochaetaceae bacterium]
MNKIVLVCILIGFPLYAQSGDQFTRPLRQIKEALPERFLEYRAPAEPVLFAIPGIEQALTQDYIAQYLNPRWSEWLVTIIQRGEPYLGFIRQEIEKRNLPPELLYLPVIESEYRISAKSKSGAVGLWQFMQNSIAPFDMKVSEWIDERMDFWKSTIGALDKLQDNYEYFSDWALTLASYNAGMGGIQRVLSQTKSADYWLLSETRQFSTETVHFVPKLLAVSYILSQPRRFNLDFLWPTSIDWVRLPVERQVDLSLVAAAAGIPTGTLKDANYELKYNVSPPDSTYYIKVDAADAHAVRAALEQKDISLIKYYFYTIKSGDTLLALALHYGVSVDTILASNPGTKERALKIGSHLLIPAYKDIEPYQDQGQSKGKMVNVETTDLGTHLVRKGETLWSLSRAYNTSPETLAAMNEMRLNDVLREGRVIKTPVK